MDIKQIEGYGVGEKRARELFEQIQRYIEQKKDENEKEIQKKWDEKIKKFNLENYVEKQLIISGARNIKATIALIDMDKFLNEGIDEKMIKTAINDLKQDENTSFLFLDNTDDKKVKGNTPFERKMAGTTSVKNMNYEELCKYYENNILI